MYPITHMTIAVGGVWIGERLWRRLRRLAGRPSLSPEVAEQPSNARLDYRLVALGALIPDLIDKPLKLFVLPSLPDDHTYGHTLILSVAIIAVGFVLARRGDTRLLALGLGCLTHPLVDPVVIYPRTLFWPLFGAEFPVATGIPGWYLRLADVVLVGFAIAIWQRDWFSRIRRGLLRHGTLDRSARLTP